MFAKYKYITMLALASAPSALGNFGNGVISYDPGTGFATGYTDASTALGQPNRNTSFGPVQPFNPPFQATEMVSLGVAGSLVLRMDAPILNNAANPFGLDFIIYGSAGFIDIDYPNGRTDSSASLFSDNPGTTRVSISADNATFYTLNPSLAPVVDRLFPTDGAGQFGLPINPSLAQSDFANLTFAQIRDLYAGSAGGAAFDLAWAQDSSGNAVFLDSIQYIRIDVLTGRAEIDGIAAVPEPRTWALLICGGVSLLFIRRRS